MTTKFLSIAYLDDIRNLSGNNFGTEKIEIRYRADGILGGSIRPDTFTDIKAVDYTAKVGEVVLVNSAGGAITITPPSSNLEKGDMFTVIDAGADATTNAITVDTSGQKYHSLSVDKILSTNSEVVTLMWTGNTTFGWVQI